jgi:hypothetical protein
MLYENEIIKQYDPISGDEIDEIVERGSEDKQIEALIETSRKFKELTATKGWQEIEKFLKDRIDEYTQMLIWDKDEKRIYRIQEAIKSYDNIFKHIAQTIREADLYEQERTLQKEANPRSNK